jgi:hypothetical protein
MTMSQDILVCPACETENDALRRTCVNCGQALIVVCPRCNAVNAITAEQCFACGQRFDMLGQIIARHEVRLEDRFTRQAAAASEARSGQKEKDQARSQQLWEQERQRQNGLADQLQRRKAQERKLMLITAVVAIMVVAIILISALAR